ncbi:MAG: cytochrome d ubiquinol oxidase subunit II [Gammaproteobacteria bacterium]|nr:cytochrome d ubiquinol oxidase subunit II [Gammaproteobacteria bacterium]
MDTYSILQILGWITVAAVLFLFAATCGFDFGAGMLAPFIGRNDDERRAVINTVGPTWDGNQVWLITAGGAIFAIWPRVYAASFSGLYFAILLILWSLFLRPVSFEYRSKLASPTWRKSWDWALCVGSFLPVLLLGAAVGNLFLGLPFQFNPISLRFFYGDTMQNAAAFTDLFGLLRPFALYVGVFCVIMMLMQGASYLVFRTEGIIQTRARKVALWTSSVFIILFAIAGFWVSKMIGYVWTPSADPILNPLNVQVSLEMGGWLSNYHHYSWMILAPVLVFLGAFATLFFSITRKYLSAFCASTLTIFGTLATWGLSMYPFLMPSSVKPEQSLTVFNATSSQLSLIGILITALIMVPIIFIYTAFVYRKLWGRNRKMSAELVKKEEHTLY